MMKLSSYLDLWQILSGKGIKVQSENFARVLFSRNKSLPNVEITLSFIDVGKSFPIKVTNFEHGKYVF